MAITDANKRHSLSRRLKTLAVVLCGMTAASFSTLSGVAQAQDAFTPKQTEALQGIIADYIRENPEIVLEALQALEARQQAETEERRKASLASLGDALVRNPLTPVAGNPDGDVTIVEFFDYNCGFCRSVTDRLMTAIADDGNVRIIFVEFPILHETSTYAARAALASLKQGKYEEFHIALMQARGRLSTEQVENIAKSVGLDWAQLQSDMADPEIQTTLEQNKQVAQSLEVRGTPAFVIGQEFVPGAIDRETIDRLIATARDAG